MLTRETLEHQAALAPCQDGKEGVTPAEVKLFETLSAALSGHPGKPGHTHPDLLTLLD